jgi:hypothetical protein
LIDGKVMVPVRAEGPNGLIGDAMVELLPSDPDYLAVRAWIEANEW